MNYSENQFVFLAQSNPKELARILTNQNLNTRVLTLGLEILGLEATDEAIVLPIFRMCLKHVHMTVRESALTGLSAFYSNKLPPQDILDRLEFISKNDPSFTLKESAQSLLMEFSNVQRSG